MDERRLIEQAGRGDEDAFEQLVVTYEKMVYNLVLRMVGSREDAFDLAQETFIKAWHAISLFQFDSKFSTWLCRIASNTCIDFLRKERKRKMISLTVLDDEDAQYEIPVADSRMDPAEITQERWDRQVVYDALQSLPAEYRTVLSLRAIEDMSYEEIGDVLDLKQGTVKSRIARAREKLRRELCGNFSLNHTSDKEKEGMR